MALYCDVVGVHYTCVTIFAPRENSSSSRSRGGGSDSDSNSSCSSTGSTATSAASSPPVHTSEQC